MSSMSSPSRVRTVATAFLCIVVVIRLLSTQHIAKLNLNGNGIVDDNAKIPNEDEMTTTTVSSHVDRSTAASHALSLDVEHFLTTFVAANPNYTDDCKAYLRSPQAYNRERNDYINWRWHFSQYNQDWFMFVNFFHEFVTTGRKGFYVESGTNDWLRVSNTALYDLCLGWEGICIEPTRSYHHNIRKRRSCQLVTNCLSDKTETIQMQGEVPGGNKGSLVKCVRLDSVLDKYNVTNVDLWSLDIEGFEFKALAGVDFTKYNIQGLLMEQQDFASSCSQFPIDYRLTMLGYIKYRIVSDGFYWKSKSPVRFPNRTAMDGWFVELEKERCKKQGHYLKFFTDS